MRALVTGATGFLGRSLARRFVADGAEVHAVVRPGSDVARLPAGVRAHLHDGSTKGMLALASEVRPEIAFHLASLAVSEHTSEQVDELVRANVLLPAQLLEALAAAGTRWLVNTGSAWQHGSGEGYDPICLYAATKQAAEDVIRFYVASAGLSAITLKLFHVYGPGDPRPRLVNQLARAALTGRSLPMTEGEQAVDLVYLDDAVLAFVRAAELLREGAVRGQAAFAVSSGSTRSVRDVVAAMGRVAGRAVPVRYGVRPYKRRELFAPISMGPPLPGWTPRVPFETGLRRVLEAERAREE